MNTKELLKSLGWSDELIAEAEEISKKVSRSVVTEKYDSDTELIESNVSQSSSLLFEDSNVSGSLMIK